VLSVILHHVGKYIKNILTLITLHILQVIFITKYIDFSAKKDLDINNHNTWMYMYSNARQFSFKKSMINLEINLYNMVPDVIQLWEYFN
jgi:hypothetical protein